MTLHMGGLEITRAGAQKTDKKFRYTGSLQALSFIQRLQTKLKCSMNLTWQFKESAFSAKLVKRREKVSISLRARRLLDDSFGTRSPDNDKVMENQDCGRNTK